MPSAARVVLGPTRGAEGGAGARALSLVQRDCNFYKTGGHRSQTADALGISRKVLWEEMRDHGLLAQGESDE